jgi:hypothetical protein
MSPEYLLSIITGICLSASCGFRIFVPLLAMSIAVHAGYLPAGGSFSWLASDSALVLLAIATLLEIGAYYIPWLDNLLDSIATPAAVAAGVAVTFAFLGDIPAPVKWALALIAGGGSAGVVQASTVMLRAASSGSTGGSANPVLSTAELGGAVGGATLAIFSPLLAALGLLIALLLLFVLLRSWRRRRAKKAEQDSLKVGHLAGQSAGQCADSAAREHGEGAK